MEHIISKSKKLLKFINLLKQEKEKRIKILEDKYDLKDNKKMI